MEFCSSFLKVILALEALVFLPGLPAWGRLTGASQATQAYLLCLGLFCAVALVSFQGRKPYAQIWGWAAAGSNLPVFPALTPVGILLTALLLVLHLRVWPRGRSWNRAPFSALAGSWWIGLLGLAFCWSGAWHVHRFSRNSGLPETTPLILLVGVWVAVPVCLLAHRGGHWLAGWSADLQLIGAWSGWADPEPAAWNETAFRPRLFLWTLGGPLASLGFGAMFLAVFTASPESFWSNFGEMAGLIAVCSLAIFFVSILPWTAFGYRSDGASLLSIVRRGPAYERDRAVAMIAGDWLQGVAPRDWNPRSLRAATALPDRSRQYATACGLYYLYCLDNGFDSSARYWMGRLVSEFEHDKLAVPVRWRLETAFFLAALDGSGRVAEAPAWQRSAGRATAVPSSLRLRTEAALAAAQGRAELAGTLILAAERAVLAGADSRLLSFEMDLLSRLRERLEPAIGGDNTLSRPMIAVRVYDQNVVPVELGGQLLSGPALPEVLKSTTENGAT